jgi:hypothetical protein
MSSPEEGKQGRDAEDSPFFAALSEITDNNIPLSLPYDMSC